MMKTTAKSIENSQLRGVYFLLFLSGVLAVGGSVVVPQIDGLLLLIGGAAFTCLICFAFYAAVQGMFQRGIFLAAKTAAELSASPVLLTDKNAFVVFQNKAVQDEFGDCLDAPISQALDDDLIEPLPAIAQLLQDVKGNGAASQEFLTDGGQLKVHVRKIGCRYLLWQIQRSEAGSGGAFLPSISVGRHGVILSMNTHARALFGMRVHRLDQIAPVNSFRDGQIVELVTKDGQKQTFITKCVARAVGRTEFILVEHQVSDCMSQVDCDSLPIGLLTISREGIITMANSRARILLNQSDVQGGPLAAYFEGLGRSIPDWISDAYAGRGLNKSEFLRVSRDDREVFVQVYLSRIEDQGTEKLIALLNDATELKTLERQFVQSQKMQAIGQLAGGVAHDFNNLLTAISGHCDLMLLRHDKGGPDYPDLVQIHQNANRAAGLVEQLLAFSRKQTLRPEVLDLRDTLSDLTHLLNRLVGETVSLQLKHDPLLPPIRADRRQIEQVLMNLVVNARDAMANGGKIVIETEKTVLDEPLVRNRASVPPGEYVLVQVIDEGEGIPEDLQQKIFEPFYTTKRTGEGTGLGLSTVYGIVKQSGGYIFVNSEMGKGTTFQILFPVHSGPAISPVSEMPEPVRMPTKAGQGVILLVEDEAPVRAFASRALRLRGYTVIEAESAEAALNTLADGTLHIDLFVSDVIMPGMDGPTWVRKAREMRPDVSVVFVSGYAEDAFGGAAQDMGKVTFLPKPFSLSALTDTVSKALG